jgi:hypothetical protein
VLLGEDTMINVRKLRVLQRKGEEMERQKVVEKTRKYLASVGDRIKAIATQEHTRREIWKASPPLLSQTVYACHIIFISDR